MSCCPANLRPVVFSIHWCFLPESVIIWWLPNSDFFSSIRPSTFISWLFTVRTFPFCLYWCGFLDSYFMKWTVMLLSLFWCSNCSWFGHWEPIKLPSVSFWHTFIILKVLSSFWAQLFVPSSSYTFLTLAWNQPFLCESLVLFSG